MCEFESLYFSDEGYVVRCKECSHYQVAFLSTMLTLTPAEFKKLYHRVKYELEIQEFSINENQKIVAIPTTTQEIHLLFTRKEAKQFSDIMEEADNEATSLAMIRMFNP